MLTGGFRTARAMADAVASGAVDVVGIARPLCTEPDLCACILDGSADAAREIDIRTNVKLFDDMLQSFWHNHQMKRMAHGLDPNLGASKWVVLAKGMAEQVVANPFAKGRSYAQAVDVEG